MRGLVALGERAAAPATELSFTGVETAMGAAPTFIYVDEAWRMLSDEVSADWLYDAIRTFRKRNAGITLATQSITEIANSPYRDLLLESCPGKIFLPNPEAKGEYVHNAYLRLGLSEREIEIIAEAQPRRQYYFHSSQGRRLFTLELGAIALALCAATGHRDVAQARELLKQHAQRNSWTPGSMRAGSSLSPKRLEPAGPGRPKLLTPTGGFKMPINRDDIRDLLGALHNRRRSDTGLFTSVRDAGTGAGGSL